MLKYFRMLLFDLGALTSKVTRDKVDFLLYKELNIYNTKFTNEVFKMPNRDILIDIEYIENILSKDMYEYQSSVSNYLPVNVYGSVWLSDKGEMLYNGNEVFIRWLMLYTELSEEYYKYTSDLTYGKAYSNFAKIKTYIINTEYVIDKLLEYIRANDRAL